jgi:uncharacterized cupin superfamily protein
MSEYTVSSIDELGEGYGFRKIRKALGVTAFGANALVLPPGYKPWKHFHEEQEELYIVLSGQMEIAFGDGTSHILGPGGLARVAPGMARSAGNASDSEDLVFVCVGGKDGYVGRDAHVAEGEDAPESFRRPA